MIISARGIAQLGPIGREPTANYFYAVGLVCWREMASLYFEPLKGKAELGPTSQPSPVRKRKRKDVQVFERRVEENVFQLHRELKAKNYKHGPYHSFFICDPKVRHIRKAGVRDRLVHQAVHTALTQVYEPKLIHHLYSARVGKGTHRAVKALREMAQKVSQNKVIVRPLHQGIDFLGYVTLPEHRVLRTNTKRRMRRKLSKRLDSYFTGETDSDSMNQTLQSYLGILSHADAFRLKQDTLNAYCWR